ncbi:hypothetical protein Tco_0417112 [Tanacetum coccineum]
MMDIYDDRFKDVCEPESDDSSSPTSTIVEEFDSLVGEIIKQKEEVKKISDPVARRRVCFTSNLKNCRIIHQGRVIHSLKLLRGCNFHTSFQNNNLEGLFNRGYEDLNFIPTVFRNVYVNGIVSIKVFVVVVCVSLGANFWQEVKEFGFDWSCVTFSNPLWEKKDDCPSRSDESVLRGLPP